MVNQTNGWCSSSQSSRSLIETHCFYAKMMSLLQLPQNIWRENIAFFFSAAEELVRLDSAVVNKSDRKVFLSNISGCKRFFRMENKQHSIRWLVSRNIIVKKVTFSFELQLEDIPHFPMLLEPVTCIEFPQDSLRLFDDTKLQTAWLCSFSWSI